MPTGDSTNEMPTTKRPEKKQIERAQIAGALLRSLSTLELELLDFLLARQLEEHLLIETERKASAGTHRVVPYEMTHLSHLVWERVLGKPFLSTSCTERYTQPRNQVR